LLSDSWYPAEFAMTAPLDDVIARVLSAGGAKVTILPPRHGFNGELVGVAQAWFDPMPQPTYLSVQ
jgi:hypothetical protein